MEGIFEGNDFFAGGLMLGIMGMGLAALRYAPFLIWRIVLRVWSVTVEIREFDLSRSIKWWLAESEYGQNCRWLSGAAIWKGDGLYPVLSPGYGQHIFEFKGKRFWLTNVLEDQGVAGKKEVMNIRILGRNTEPVKNLMHDVVELANRQNENKTSVFINDKNGRWLQIRSFPKRPKTSLFLKDDLIDLLIDDTERFLQGRDWYYERGLPHRRGFLFWGPAGNGKSSIIHVIASELSLPIYLLSLSDFDITDFSIAIAVGNLPDKCLLVIEDFEKINLENKQFTISGLLNAMDGPLASEGRLLIITANEIASINDKFLRPGRIDRRWIIDNPEEKAIDVCLDHFGVDGAIDRASFRDNAVTNEWSMAQVQQEVITKTGVLKYGAGLIKSNELLSDMRISPSSGEEEKPR